jgi:succinate-acetate transporter protein
MYGAGPSLGAPATRQNFYQGQATTFRTFGNPAPLGLFSLGGTLLVWSLVNVRTDHVTTPNIVVSLAFAFGGLIQLLAGMWEFAVGNTFGATVFSAYGGFWLSYAILYIPSSGILGSYTTSELDDAYGFYLASWFIITFLIFIGSLRSNLILIIMFFTLTMMFMLLTIAQYHGNVLKITKAGGAFGIVTAFIAFYKGLANLLTPGAGFFSLPVVPVGGRAYNY